MTAKQNLHTILWSIADDLRGKMGADEFRDYMLGFIFYKYLSQSMVRYADEILVPDKMTYLEVDGRPEYLDAVRKLALDKLGYFLAPAELFSALVERGDAEGQANFILEDLQKVLNSIENSTMGTDSEEDFANLFEELDLNSSKLGKTVEDRNALVVKIMASLDGVDFELGGDSDVLGDAYEYLIGQFASGAGKKAGEFYTPQEVSSVLAKLVTVGRKHLRSVYDPTCGSGSLLLRVAKEVLDVGQFYGQESNPTTFNLCRMNMIMHDVHYRHFDIKNEDTLERPQHTDLKFDAIVANPPFSAKWSANPLKMNDARFAPYGKLAPATKADFAFVQHMIHQLDEEGTMACVLPHGVLFRGAAEGHIRKHLIEELNVLDAVIGLPANIFYGTSIPTCVLVLKKNRSAKTRPFDSAQGPAIARNSKNKNETATEHSANTKANQHNEDEADTERSRSVLFIDASQHFDKVKTQNVLNEAHINKIIETYKNYALSTTKPRPLSGVEGKGSGIKENGVQEEKYAYIAPLSEIRENDYNLNIPRYVDTFEEEEAVDLSAVTKELKQVAEALEATDLQIANYCKELGIEPPF